MFQFQDIFNICLVHRLCFLLISFSAGSWFVLCYSGLLLMVFGQRIRSILLKQLFVNTRIFKQMLFVVHQVSVSYSRTVLSFVLKIVILISANSWFELQMYFNGALALLNPRLYICIRFPLFINDAAEVCKNFHIFHGFYINYNWVGDRCSALHLRVLLFFCVCCGLLLVTESYRVSL